MKTASFERDLVKAVKNAILEFGIDNFKRTSMFASNEKVANEEKLAA